MTDTPIRKPAECVDRCPDMQVCDYCTRSDWEKAAEVAENPGFIQARDTEWDEGVNYAKRFIAAAIRAAAPPARDRDI